MSDQQSLEEAISAIREGDKATGQRLLVSILKTNPRNEQAWMWLVRVLPDDEKRVAALEKCLTINPKSEPARRMLEQLNLRMAAQKPPEPTELPPQPQSNPEEVSEPPAEESESIAAASEPLEQVSEGPSERSEAREVTFEPPAEKSEPMFAAGEPLEQISEGLVERSEAREVTFEPPEAKWEPPAAASQAPSLTPLLDRLSGRSKPAGPLPPPRIDLGVPTRQRPPILESNSKPAAKERQKTKRKLRRSFVMLEIGLVLMILVAAISLVYVIYFQQDSNQPDLAQQSQASTAAALETQDAGLSSQLAAGQIQAAATQTPSPTSPATATPRLTQTPTQTKTPLPTPIGAASFILPDNVTSMKLRGDLPGKSYAALQFLPDGQSLAAASLGGISVWSVSDLGLRRQIFLENQAERLALSPDGEELFFTQSSLESGSLLFRTSLTSPGGFGSIQPGISYPDKILGLFVLPKMESLALVVNATRSNILLVDPNDGRIQQSLDHTGGVLSTAMHPDRLILATGGGNDLVQVWDLEERQVTVVLSGHTSDITGLAFSPDGLLLASGAKDGEIRVWNTANWELATNLKLRESPILALAFTPDHQLLVSIDAQDHVDFWDTGNGDLVMTLEPLVGIKAVAFSTDGGLLAIGAEDALMVWESSSP